MKTPLLQLIDLANGVYNINSSLTPVLQALLSYYSIVVLVVLVVIALVVAGTNQ